MDLDTTGMKLVLLLELDADLGVENIRGLPGVLAVFLYKDAV